MYIDQYRPSDLRAAYRLIRDVYAADPDSLPWLHTCTEETIANWFAALSPSMSWIATDSRTGAAMGFIGLTQRSPSVKGDSNPLFEFSALMVHPDARGNGLAGRLMKVALRQVPPTFYKSVWLTVGDGSAFHDGALSRGWVELGKVILPVYPRTEKSRAGVVLRAPEGFSPDR